jgi:hypothetical protein
MAWVMKVQVAYHGILARYMHCTDHARSKCSESGLDKLTAARCMPPGRLTMIGSEDGASMRHTLDHQITILQIHTYISNWSLVERVMIGGWINLRGRCKSRRYMIGDSATRLGRSLLRVVACRRYITFDGTNVLRTRTLHIP